MQQKWNQAMHYSALTDVGHIDYNHQLITMRDDAVLDSDSFQTRDQFTKQNIFFYYF